MSIHMVSANAQLHQDRVSVAQLFTLQHQRHGIKKKKKKNLAQLNEQNLKFRNKKNGEINVGFINYFKAEMIPC